MILKELYEESLLKLSSSESPRIDTELLLGDILKLKRVDFILKENLEIEDSLASRCREFVSRRFQGEPVAYILGYKDFYKLRFLVNSDVLIPRPETELIIESVMNWVEPSEDSFQIVDLGAGSGCLGLSLASELPKAQVLGVELSPGACQVIDQNVKELCLTGNYKWLQKDVCKLVRQDFGSTNLDIVVANPPYIDFNDTQMGAGVREFEPQEALFAKDQGLACIYSWSEHIAPYLAKRSIYAIEVGYDQAQKTKDFLLQLNIFDKIDVIKDYQGIERIVVALRG